MLAAVLERDPPLVTDLVVDTRSADDCCVRHWQIRRDDVPRVRSRTDRGKPGWRAVFDPPTAGNEWLVGEVQRRHQPLDGSRLRIVQTAHPIDVAVEAAQFLLELLRLRKEHGQLKQPDQATVGLYGGKTPSLMIKALADMLSDSRAVWPTDLIAADLPRVIEFRSFVGVINNRIAEVNPNVYLNYLAGAARHHGYFEIRFATLPAPGIVLDGGSAPQLSAAELWQSPILQTAFAQRFDCDLIVLACGHWQHDATDGDHSSLGTYLETACGSDPDLRRAWEATQRQLNDRGTIGDIGWCPVDLAGNQTDLGLLPVAGGAGPHLQIIRLMDLADLARFVGARGQVLLLAGPCSGRTCQRSKQELLHAVLPCPRPVRHARGRRRPHRA